MVAIEHRVKSTPATTTAATTTATTIEITSSSNNNISSSHIVQNNSHNNNNIGNTSDLEIIHLPSGATLSPVTPTSPTSVSVTTTASTTTTNSVDKLESTEPVKMSSKVAVVVETQEKPKQNEKPKLQTQRSVDIKIAAKSQELTKKGLKLELKKSQDSQDENSLKSPKSPISARLPHQTSLNSSVDVEDRKTLREALYQGIFSRHRRTIFAFGSFLRMLRSRTSQYNTIRSSSEGEDVDEVR